MPTFKTAFRKGILILREELRLASTGYDSIKDWSLKHGDSEHSGRNTQTPCVGDSIGSQHRQHCFLPAVMEQVQAPRESKWAPTCRQAGSLHTQTEDHLPARSIGTSENELSEESRTEGPSGQIRLGSQTTDRGHQDLLKQAQDSAQAAGSAHYSLASCSDNGDATTRRRGWEAQGAGLKQKNFTS